MLLLNYPVWNLSFLSNAIGAFHIMSDVNWSLIMLTLVITILVIARDFLWITQKDLTNLIVYLTGILLVCFSTKILLIFFFFFELSLLPILFIILGWGYQPERLAASTRMLFYTLVGSMPLLLTVIYVQCVMNIRGWSLPIFAQSFNFTYNLAPTLLVTSAFLIKLPVYCGHSWLPKAHVEAPIVGSIFLASVLLKLGGYGMYQFSIHRRRLQWRVIAFRLIGGGVIRLVCIQQLDLKVIIAYSSVAHISLVAYSSFSINEFAVLGRTLIMLAHGVTSSGIFIGANLIYKRSKSRLILLNQGFLSLFPSFSLIWFLLCSSNIGGPFSLNLFSELILIMFVVNWSQLNILFILAICGLAAVYSLILYRRTQQGQKFYEVPSSLTIRVLENWAIISHSVITVISFFFLVSLFF